MTDSRGCEHEGTKVETASNRLNGVADPEGATMGDKIGLDGVLYVRLSLYRFTKMMASVQLRKRLIGLCKLVM